MKLIVTRKVTIKECWWLDDNIPAGTIVYRYDGCTYGCCTDNGIACSFEDGKTPFFELPLNALMNYNE